MVKVTFSNDIDDHEITPYSMVYGRHPRDFQFGRHGKMLSMMTPMVDDGMVRSHSVSPNERRAILERTLRNGAAWETASVEYVAKLNKKQFTKARVGSKAARHAERMETEGGELEGEAATMYRAVSARILYLSMDRPDISFSAKELCRHFAHPTKAGVDALKTVARFLVGMPRLVWQFPFQRCTNDLQVDVDSDFGGCQTTRRSTSGGIAMRGSHPVKHWSTTQTTIALSS